MSLVWNGNRVISNVETNKRQALTVGATIVEAEAKLRSPVDTGQLRSSINYTVSENQAKIGTIVDHAPFLEYGTSKQRPQPYLRPALDENIENIKRAMASVLRGAFR